MHPRASQVARFTSPTPEKRMARRMARAPTTQRAGRQEKQRKPFSAKRNEEDEENLRGRVQRNIKGAKADSHDVSR